MVGLIPTGWYPTALAIRPDGRQIYVVNGKSLSLAQIPCRAAHNLDAAPAGDNVCRAANQYVWQLEKAGFLTLPAPSGAELGRLTRQVEVNDRFPGASAKRGRRPRRLRFLLRQHIHHVI